MPHASPVIAAYPADDFQCVQDCIAGTCTDPIQDKIQSHLNAISYVQGQAATEGCPPCPCPCAPCSTADLKAFHKAKGKKAAGATTSPWASLIALLLPLLMQLLAQLFPPTPTP